VFLFLHILTNIFCHLSYWIIDFIHSEWYEAEFQLVLICISLMTKDFEHFLGVFQPLGIPQFFV
jgi:hypothetical protein